MRFLLLVAMLLLVPLPTLAQLQGFGSDPSQVHVRLVTFGAGDQIHQYFGHDALWLYDEQSEQSALFNYGMFSFGPDMLPKYLKGHLTFWVEATPVRATFEHYKRMNRSIIVQDLNLGTEEKARIVERLMHDVQPENRFYQYHHYTNNCTTRLRDDIDLAIGGQLHKLLDVPARMSYRDHTRRYSELDPVLHFALLFWMNDDMEKSLTRWDEAFLPLELADLIEGLSYVNAKGAKVPLVARRYELFRSSLPPVPTRPKPLFQQFLLFGFGGFVVLSLLGFWFGRSLGVVPRVLLGLSQAVIGATFGFLGLLGCAMWAFTEHLVTYRNENYLQANAITFALLPLGLMVVFGNRKALRWTRFIGWTLGGLSVLGLALKVLPAFDQDTRLTMAILVPLNVGLAVAQLLAKPTEGKDGAAPS